MHLFFPNYGIKIAGQSHYIPKSEHAFLGELGEADIRVSIVGILFPKHDAVADSCIEDMENVSVSPIAIPAGSFTRLSKIAVYLRMAFRLAKFFRKGEIERVYIYFPGPLPLLAALLCIVFKLEYSLYIRGVWKTTGLYGLLSRLAFRRAKFALTTGLAFRNKVGAYNRRAYPVVPMLSFDPLGQSTTQRDYSRAKKILFVGSISKSKGTFDVVEAFAKLDKELASVELILVGGCNAQIKAELLELVDSLGVSERVHYSGHISDADNLVEIYESADIFVYPSFYPEGFPRVIFEAMLKGLPIVCSILPGMQNTMVNGVNCLEAFEGDTLGLTKNISLLLKDSKIRKQLGGSAYEDANNYFKSFTAQSHAQQYLALAGEGK